MKTALYYTYILLLKMWITLILFLLKIKKIKFIVDNSNKLFEENYIVIYYEIALLNLLYIWISKKSRTKIKN